MYDYNITAQELATFNADMWEMAAEAADLTNEEMDAMAEWYGES